MKTVIEIEKLGYSYGEGWILNDLSLKIEQGDFVAVIGPNGAGKSTLLRLLAGILKPAQGRIAIFGQDRENFTAWDKIGYVPQNPARQHRAFPPAQGVSHKRKGSGIARAFKRRQYVPALYA